MEGSRPCRLPSTLPRPATSLRCRPAPAPPRAPARARGNSPRGSGRGSRTTRTGRTLRRELVGLHPSLAVVGVRPPQVHRDGLDLADLAVQRLSRMTVPRHRARGHVMQLDVHAGTLEHPGDRHGIHRHRQGGPQLVHRRGPARGLVVHHHERPSAVGRRPVVEPVDPPGQRHRAGAHRDGSLDPDRAVARGDPPEVVRDLLLRRPQPAAGHGGVAEPHVDPARGDQRVRPVHRPLLHRHVPPVPQRVVHRDPEAGVRPLRGRLRLGSVEVLQAVAPRAVEVGEQAGRARGIQPLRHPGEGALPGRLVRGLLGHAVDPRHARAEETIHRAACGRRRPERDRLWTTRLRDAARARRSPGPRSAPAPRAPSCARRCG